MGINMLGRFAAVTNFREQKAITAQTKSRGELCSQFLNLDASIDQYLKSLDEQRALFAGFNLLLGDFSNSSRPQLAYFSNRQQNPISHLPAGIFGLSNGLLNEAWPKVRTGTQALTQQLYNTPQEIQSVLLDSTPAEFEQLPNTGIEITLEQKLSSRFIKMDGYGTRSATVLRFDKSGNLEWLDQTFGPNSAYTEPQHFNLKLDINRETH